MPSSFAFSKFRLSVLFVSLCQTVVERLRSERNLACPAGAQEGRHQGFHPLVNHPFPKIVWRRPETGDRFENGERQRIFSSAGGAQSAPISLPIRSVRFHTVTHTISSLQARHKVNCPKGKRNHRVHFPFSIFNFPFYTHKKEESTRFPLARYSLLYPLGVTIASSGVPAAQSGQALPRTKFW